MIKNAVALTAVLLLGACAASSEPTALSAEQRGQVLVAQNCASCHAIGRSDESPAPEAPAFRTLSQNYRVSALEEALAEGISVGHPAMPNFSFAPDDVDAVIAYLDSIQEAP